MVMKRKRENVPAGKFKAECLAMMDIVAEGTVEYVITKRGKPVAKLVPVEQGKRPYFGRMKGTLRIVGDIIAPLDAKWEANEGL
jgi:prevent-host-death family protein